MVLAWDKLWRVLKGVLFLRDWRVALVAGGVILSTDLALKQLFHESIVYNHYAGLGISIVNAEQLLLIGLVLVVIGLIVVALQRYLQKEVLPKRLLIWAVFLLLVGSSNLIDRFLYGAVRDYIYLGLFWVNLADIAIVIWLVSYLVYELKYSHEK